MKPYHRNDNKLHEHEKFREAGITAAGMWMMCRSYCADNWTDGFIPRFVAQRYVPKGMRLPQLAAKLVAVGLWDEVDGGWQMHDYADWNTTVAERDEANAAAAERMRKARSRDAGATQVRRKRDASATQARRKTPEPAGQTEMFARTDEQEVRTRTRTRRETASLAAPGTALETTGNAGTIVGEWIKCCARRPTQEWIGQVSRKIRLYLEEGYPYDIVREAILAWAGTGKQPTQIDFHMNQILNPPTKPTWGAPRRASTTDGIFEDGLGVMARAAERDRYATQREITNEPEGTVRNPGHVSRAF